MNGGNAPLLLPLKHQASNAVQAEDLPPEVDCSTFDNLALPIWRTMIAKSKCLAA
jgi:hypothetical protein